MKTRKKGIIYHLIFILLGDNCGIDTYVDMSWLQSSLNSKDCCGSAGFASGAKIRK